MYKKVAMDTESTLLVNKTVRGLRSKPSPNE